MKIFDFNVHLPEECFFGLLASEQTTSSLQLTQRLKKLDLPVVGANVMLFNQSLLSISLSTIKCSLEDKFEKYSMTQLVNPRSTEWLQQIDNVDIIKFHAYHQNITRKDYSSIVNICKVAEVEGKPICIDTSYGSAKMYKNNPMELACYIADEIKNTPIILLHSGGLKCWEAFLLAISQDNIFVETSFTVDHYWGSSIINDLKFIYNKLGADKIIFGSDTPYCDYDTQLKQMRQLLIDIKFTDDDIEKVLYRNALSMLPRYE